LDVESLRDLQTALTEILGAEENASA
jgi:hypothetical protein